MANCITVSNYNRTLVNGTSPRQIPVHILMSLEKTYSCNVQLCVPEWRNKQKNRKKPKQFRSNQVLNKKVNTLIQSMRGTDREKGGENQRGSHWESDNKYKWGSHSERERGRGGWERETDLLDSHVCLKKLSVVYMYAHERNLILMFLVGTMKLH